MEEFWITLSWNYWMEIGCRFALKRVMFTDLYTLKLTTVLIVYLFFNFRREMVSIVIASSLYRPFRLNKSPSGKVWGMSEVDTPGRSQVPCDELPIFQSIVFLCKGLGLRSIQYLGWPLGFVVALVFGAALPRMQRNPPKIPMLLEDLLRVNGPGLDRNVWIWVTVREVWG